MELKPLFKNIADAIREKDGSSDDIVASDFPDRIRAIQANVPTGVIVIWSGAQEDIPTGWALCDGQDGRPDLRDKFVLGAGTAYSVGEIGGSEEVTLTVRQMPCHDHELVLANSSDTVVHFSKYQKLTSSSINYYDGPPDVEWNPDQGKPNYYPNVSYMEDTGWSEPHPNMPPYYVLAYIMKL